MRIHTNTLTADDIATAASYAAAAGHGRVYVDSLTTHGSRSRARAFDVKLIGDGSHSRRRNHEGTDYAATYDAWGYFLALLFSIDPEMTCPYYSGAEDFHAKTDHKYHAPAHVL